MTMKAIRPTTFTLDIFTGTLRSYALSWDDDKLNKLQTISFSGAVVSWNVMRLSLDIYLIKETSI
jgi:hypothetical protein